MTLLKTVVYNKRVFVLRMGTLFFVLAAGIAVRNLAGGREEVGMAEVRVGKNESLDSALRRFKRSCQKSGILVEARKHEHYLKPSVKKKKKSEAARKRRWS